MTSGTCPYCKIDFASNPWADPGKDRTPKAVCLNCRHYHHNTLAEIARLDELEMFQTYWAVPLNWRESDDWRGDPSYLMENKPQL